MKWALLFYALMFGALAQETPADSGLDTLMSVPVDSRRARNSGLGEILKIEAVGGRVYALGRLATKVQPGLNTIQLLPVRLIEWDGVHWRFVQIPSASPISIAAIGESLFVGAQSAGSAQVLQRVSSGWRPLGSPLPANATNLLAAGTNLFVGSSATPLNLWHWNGATWTDFGTFEMTGALGAGKISSVAQIASTTFVAGKFIKAGNIRAINVAAKSGAWTPLDKGLGQGIVWETGVTEMASFGGNVIALAPPPKLASKQTIWIWAGQSWKSANVPYEYLHSLRRQQNSLLMIGAKTDGPGRSDRFLLRYDGTNLVEAAPPIEFKTTGIGGKVRAQAIALDGTNIYVGGSITVSEPACIPFVATLKDSTWRALTGSE